MNSQIVAWLNRRNPTAVFLATAFVVGGSLVIGGWFAAVMLLALSAGVAGLLTTVWDRLTPGGRVARLAILAILVAVAVYTII